MKGIRATAILVISLVLSLTVLSPAIAEDQSGPLFKQYWGTIMSITIDRCGTQPGLCRGSVILAQRGGGEVSLAIRPGTWIRQGGRLVHLEELRVGHDVHVQAMEVTTKTP
jgi:uncharacterized membrane protein